MRKRFIKYFIFIAIAVIVGACSGNDSDQLNEIEASFQTRKDVIYEKAQTDLKQDHIFEFQISKKAQKVLKERGYPSHKYFSIYTDKQLNNELDFEYDNEDGTILVAPISTPTLNISSDAEEVIVNKANEWGIFDHYFLVQHVDLDTGDNLEKPIVTVFTVQQDLATPEVKMSFTKDGIMNLSWDEVSGAKEYALIKVDFLGDETSAQVIAFQKETTWSSKDANFDTELVEEELLRSYYLSEDEQLSNEVDYWWEDRTITDFQGSKFAVVALHDKKSSAMSYMLDNKYEPASLTCQIAQTAIDENNFSHSVDTIQDVETTIPLTACDGASVNRKVTYDSNNITSKDDGIHIPYHIDNSTMRNEFIVANSTLEEVTAEIEKRQGSKDEETPFIYANKKMIPAHARTSSMLPKIDDDVFSSSEFETYVAKNMIDGAHKIDVSGFKDAKDVMYVYDLLGEVINQNPLILKVLEIEYDSQDKIIYVEYLFDHATRVEKQEAIRSQVPAVVAEIITPEMSDIEKVFAINQYICDQTTYDHVAADAIIASGGKAMDATKYDSNTATGVFTNGLAVCEGYASAFNLLANEAGLDSIVITGNLNSDMEVRHAWNRVRINDQWYVVDTTTNDADDVGNSILNLSDEKASLFLTQDDIFLLDDDIPNYTAVGDDAEYYRQMDLYISAEGAADAYVSRFGNSNSVVLRIPETLNESEIDSVADQVFNRLNRSIEYIYLNGVLRINLH